MLGEFRSRFWQRPRAHGDVIEDRTVSFLELFYDLVYVVVISRAAHTLAEHISWRTVGEFAVVFALIWFAWVNGTLYYELHGREDGRTRVFVFVQMLLLAVLAVFTSNAAGENGATFAAVYTLYLVVLTWLWYTVRRQDTEEYMTITARYLTGMIIAIAVMGVSVALPQEPRLVAWAVLMAGWLVGVHFIGGSVTALGLTATDSMVERLGLFVIIVLGEVVVGVVNGLSETDRTFRSVATGMLGLAIGFAFWWTYFDYVGRRLPRDDRLTITRWITSHLPVSLSIAAGGAAMVSLIAHAGDGVTPAPTAWLLAGSVAFGLVALIIHMATLQEFERKPALYRPVMAAIAVAAVAAVLAGWLAPAPWLLALILVATLIAVWFFAVDRWLRVGGVDVLPKSD
jgi:low temperature requirement protein LtrA